jgi:hypothetical protein
MLTACALGAAACSARSGLDDPGGGGRPSGSSVTGTGGSAPDAVPFSCDGAITFSTPLSLAAGTDTPSLVFGSNDGETVSILHHRSETQGGTELHASTLRPWGAWPPAALSEFTVDAKADGAFLAENAAYGHMQLLLRSVDSSGASGLLFSTPMSATSPGVYEGLPVAPDPIVSAPKALVRGYDTPPIAYNLGYFAMLAVWDAEDPSTHAHSLELGVDTSGADILSGLVSRPDEPNLACADRPIPVAAARVGKSWIVVAGAGAPFQSCDASSAGAPTSLVVDRMAWGPVDSLDWTLDRTDTKLGKKPIEWLKMATTHGGALVLVSRAGDAAPTLVPVSPEGKLGDAIPTDAPPDGRVSDAALGALDDGSLVAYVDEAATGKVRVEARDRDGKVRARGELSAGGAVSDLTTLVSKDGTRAIFAWTATDGAGTHVEAARIDCGATP